MDNPTRYGGDYAFQVPDGVIERELWQLEQEHHEDLVMFADNIRWILDRVRDMAFKELGIHVITSWEVFWAVFNGMIRIVSGNLYAKQVISGCDAEEKDWEKMSSDQIQEFMDFQRGIAEGIV
jgi:hypothetical protein